MLMFSVETHPIYYLSNTLPNVSHFVSDVNKTESNWFEFMFVENELQVDFDSCAQSRAQPK